MSFAKTAQSGPFITAPRNTAFNSGYGELWCSALRRGENDWDGNARRKKNKYSKGEALQLA